MLTLLSHIFIKDRDNTEDPGVRQAYGVLCGALGILLNLLLFAGKCMAGILSRSIAITADAFNNLSDAGSSVITLIGFKMAGQRPDSHHPFGHGRIEYISGLLVSVVILLMGLELLKSSVLKIFHPEEISYSPTVLLVLLASILVKCYMAFYQRTLGKRLASATLRATATDSLSDSVATSIVLVTTLVYRFTGINLDGYGGVLVGLFICYAGYCAARDTVNPLLGQAPEPEFVEKIQEIVLSYESIIGIHDLIVHNYGPGRVLISLHAEVPADGDLIALHDTIDTAEHRLHETLHCSAVIHMDPVLVGDAETEGLKEQVAGSLKGLDSRLSLHDFRLVKCSDHTNVLFDISAPYELSKTDEELTDYARDVLYKLNSGYRGIIEVDRQMA